MTFEHNSKAVRKSRTWTSAGRELQAEVSVGVKLPKWSDLHCPISMLTFLYGIVFLVISHFSSHTKFLRNRKSFPHGHEDCWSCSFSVVSLPNWKNEDKEETDLEEFHLHYFVMYCVSHDLISCWEESWWFELKVGKRERERERLEMEVF